MWLFAAIDIAARPEIEFRCGEEGRFIDRSGNSRATEKGNSYPSNAHRGKMRKAQMDKHPFIIIEQESPRVPRRGWAEMIKKVYEVNPLACPKCRGEMRIIAFLTDYAVVDRIIHHLKLTFVAERPPPPQMAFQELFMAAEASTEYSS